eukprot:6002710-Prymnesium_polylepis.2
MPPPAPTGMRVSRSCHTSLASLSAEGGAHASAARGSLAVARGEGMGRVACMGGGMSSGGDASMGRKSRSCSSLDALAADASAEQARLQQQRLQQRAAILANLRSSCTQPRTPSQPPAL